MTAKEYKKKEEKINSYLQKSLLLAFRYGDETKIGKQILAVASRVAHAELEYIKPFKPKIARCRKCGEEIRGDEDSLCGYCV